MQIATRKNSRNFLDSSWFERVMHDYNWHFQCLFPALLLTRIQTQNNMYLARIWKRSLFVPIKNVAILSQTNNCSTASDRCICAASLILIDPHVIISVAWLIQIIWFDVSIPNKLIESIELTESSWSWVINTQMENMGGCDVGHFWIDLVHTRNSQY